VFAEPLLQNVSVSGSSGISHNPDDLDGLGIALALEKDKWATDFK
jgi:hypothetical protein